jgi:hypothetical protein
MRGENLLHLPQGHGQVWPPKLADLAS